MAFLTDKSFVCSQLLSKIVKAEKINADRVIIGFVLFSLIKFFIKIFTV